MNKVDTFIEKWNRIAECSSKHQYKFSLPADYESLEEISAGIVHTHTVNMLSELIEVLNGLEEVRQPRIFAISIGSLN